MISMPYRTSVKVGLKGDKLHELAMRGDYGSARDAPPHHGDVLANRIFGCLSLGSTEAP